MKPDVFLLHEEGLMKSLTSDRCKELFPLATTPPAPPSSVCNHNERGLRQNSSAPRRTPASGICLSTHPDRHRPSPPKPRPHRETPRQTHRTRAQDARRNRPTHRKPPSNHSHDKRLCGLCWTFPKHAPAKPYGISSISTPMQ